MKLLLDTNAFYWLRTSPVRVPDRAKAEFLRRTNEVYLSIVTPWEIAIKAAKGSLAVPPPGLTAWVEEAISLDVKFLPLQLSHIARLQQLPLNEHRDPFDRILVAQALAEGLTLVSCDAHLSQYDVPVLWR